MIFGRHKFSGAAHGRLVRWGVAHYVSATRMKRAVREPERYEMEPKSAMRPSLHENIIGPKAAYMAFSSRYHRWILHAAFRCSSGSNFLLLAIATVSWVALCRKASAKRRCEPLDCFDSIGGGGVDSRGAGDCTTTDLAASRATLGDCVGGASSGYSSTIGVKPAVWRKLRRLPGASRVNGRDGSDDPNISAPGAGAADATAGR